MTRWITGIILATFVTLMLFFAPVAWGQIFVIILAALAAWEFFTLIGSDVRSRYFGAAFTVVGVNVILHRFEMSHLLAFFYMTLICGFLLKLALDAEPLRERFNQVSYFCLGVFYLAVSFGCIGLLLTLPRAHFWVFLTLASTFLADTLAYIVGRKWGKRKLAPEISPGKTEEGFWGSLFGGVVGSVLVRQLFWPEFNLPFVMLLGIVIAILGVTGDLSESLIKRAFNAKDSGKIIPGHGGILDRVDSVLFSAPVVYFLAVWLAK